MAGAKRITVKSADGKTFKSISKAAIELAGGSASKRKSKGSGRAAEGDGMRQREKQRLTLSSSPKGLYHSAANSCTYILSTFIGRGEEHSLRQPTVAISPLHLQVDQESSEDQRCPDK
jgi:hypothetical protein